MGYKIALPPEQEAERAALIAWTFEKELDYQEEISGEFDRHSGRGKLNERCIHGDKHPKLLGHPMFFYANLKCLMLKGEPLAELNEAIEAGRIGPLIFEFLGITEAVDAWIVAREQWEKYREEQRISEIHEIWREADKDGRIPF